MKTKLYFMANFKLSDKLISKLPKQNKKYYDSKISGLGIRTTENGSKSFFIDYKINQHQKRVSIGKFPVVSTDIARKKARIYLGEVELGVDPSDNYKGHTIGDMWEKFQQEHLPKLSHYSQRDYRSMYNTYLLKEYSKYKVSKLSRLMVQNLHLEISNHAPTMANRLVEFLKGMYSKAIIWGWLDNNPCVGIEKNQENKRNFYLSEEQYKNFWKLITEKEYNSTVGVIILATLTGSRRGETLKAKWEQFDLDKGVWVKPKENTKQGREHRVMLNDVAIKFLRQLKAISSTDHIFPSYLGDRPMVDIKRVWCSLSKEFGVSFRFHDLRHIFASLLISKGVGIETIGALLGHSGKGITSRYAHIMDEPLRAATNIITEVLYGKKENIYKT